jgi:hypothetical protein
MKNRLLGRIGSNLSVLLVFLFSITLALSISISTAIGAVYDDFNGSEINSTLWRINDPCHILSQSESFLRVSSQPTCYGSLSSTRRFSGDFEFALEYTNFQSTATVHTVPGGNVPQIEIQVTSCGNNFVSIWKGYFPGATQTNLFLSGALVNGKPGESFSAPATSPSGSLKISRIGSTIRTYYNEGTDWVRLGRFENTFVCDVVLQIMVYTGDDGTFTVASDNVYASDQVGTCQQQLQVLQAQVGTLSSQNQTLTSQNQILTQQNGQLQTQVNAVNSGLSNIQQNFVQVFSNPQFTIPGATPLEQYQNLVDAILGLNRGRLQGLYMNLGGK